MSHLPFHQQQVDFISSLAQHRIEALNPFFLFLNYFDSPYFFYLLVPIIWIGCSYRWGLRIFYWFTLNNLINSYIKYLVGWPRPTEVGMLQITSNGFPSFGAQNCFFLGALLIYYWRTPTAWIIGSTYILLISFSRLYLGVHFPIDILGGWAIALLLLILFIITKKPLEKFLSKIGLTYTLLLSLSLPLILVFIAPKTIYIMGSTLGVGLGSYFALKYHLLLSNPKTVFEVIGRSLVAIGTLALILILWPHHSPLYTKSFAAGLLMSLFASPICHWFMEKKIR